MSGKNHTRAQKHWYTSVHKIILINIKAANEVKKKEKTEDKQLFYNLKYDYRIAYNTYGTSDYFAAIVLLEKVCKGGDWGLKKNLEKETPQQEDYLNKDYRVHLTTARCCVQLFLLTRSHYHLEQAYYHFTNSIETMTVGLATMFTLPAVLLEFGRMLEHYGAFTAALELYTKIITNFPNFRGYFDAMYRSAVVGRHIIQYMTDPLIKDETLNKCIDILTFLLEALPSSIEDIHIVILFARTLEASSSASLRFRATGVYQNLYDHCRSFNPMIGNTENHKTFNAWNDDPQTWYLFGEQLGLTEPLLAKYSYELFIKGMTLKLGFGKKDLSSLLGIETCMKIASNYASFQGYDDAIKYGELALKIDHFNKQTRSSLSQWSKIFAVSLEKERQGVLAIESNWRGRMWSTGYRKKIRNNIIIEMEEKMKVNRLDEDARKDLAYYARDKWRARFLFEASCAATIQHFFRTKKKIWFWQSALRASYLQQASTAYNLFTKKPRDIKNRLDIIRITNHKMCPRRHAINRTRQIINDQDVATNTIRKNWKSYSWRIGVARCITNRRNQVFQSRYLAATTIQCLIRIHIAHNVRLRKEILLKKVIRACKIIQRFIRWRNKQFQHAVTQIIARIKRKRVQALLTLAFTFPFHFKIWICKRRENKLLMDKVYQLELEKKRIEDERILREKAIKCIIKHLKWRKSHYMIRITRKMHHERKNIMYSRWSTSQLDKVQFDHLSKYNTPGISKKSQLFFNSLQQVNNYCNNTFAPTDCMMLSNVLKHKNCCTRKLFFHNVNDLNNPSYMFDMLPALSACCSLRSISILGGEFSQYFLAGIISNAQEENPRIKELCIERQENAGDILSLYGGRILCDFFNYSLPGLSTLSLHGCRIKDSHLELLANGIAVNYSIVNIILSLNLITDEGFLILFKALTGNKKSILELLDLGWNMILLDKECRLLIDNYINHSDYKNLELCLLHNMLRTPYVPKRSKNNKVEINVLCESEEVLNPSKYSKRSHLQNSNRCQRSPQSKSNTPKGQENINNKSILLQSNNKFDSNNSTILSPILRSVSAGGDNNSNKRLGGNLSPLGSVHSSANSSPRTKQDFKSLKALKNNNLNDINLF